MFEKLLLQKYYKEAQKPNEAEAVNKTYQDMILWMLMWSTIHISLDEQLHETAT